MNARQSAQNSNDWNADQGNVFHPEYHNKSFNNSVNKTNKEIKPGNCKDILKISPRTRNYENRSHKWCDFVVWKVVKGKISLRFSIQWYKGQFIWLCLYSQSFVRWHHRRRWGGGRVGLAPVLHYIQKHQVIWLGHVTRLPPNSTPQNIFMPRMRGGGREREDTHAGVGYRR